MQRFLVVEWFMVVVVIFALSNAPVRAQTWKEPMLDGVPYSEMAQWSFTYGRGALYGGACPPMPPPGIWYSGAPDYVGPPPISRKKARSRRK